MSGGRSTQSQASTFTDNRVAMAEGSNYATGGSSITNISQTLDGNAINMAGQFASGVASDAFGLAGDALSSNNTATGQALNFGSDALGGALSTVQDVVTQALNFGSDALSGALASNDATTTKAFNFGSDSLAFAGDAYKRALDVTTHNTDQALQLTAAAYEDAKGRGALTDKLLMLAVAAMAVVAFSAVKH